MGRVYATEADLTGYGAPPGVTLPTGAAAAWSLARASERVDELLLTAVYEVDTNGLPTDPTVVAALRDAVCAQVGWWAETGTSPTGAPPRYSSVKLGSLALTKTAGGSSPDGGAGRYAPDAVRHLRLAGLLSGQPSTGGWWG
ncbi:hypothetical protein [Saccharothrix sp. HUAS TT1]|uniref:hypothetical protein n=1 Tax=unclassified Saccharothrix TaxID=2593673 RepID=UPI00345C0488